MKIGMVGLGKLGFPVILAIESKGHEVYGYDIQDHPKKILESRVYPHEEKDIQSLLHETNIKIRALDIVVNDSDILFVAVQTPHEPQFEGISPLPSSSKDFNYEWIVEAMEKISQVSQKEVMVAIISTMLPGTVEREIRPIISDNIKLVYNPFFIAMGTVIEDFLNPEFVLMGLDNLEAERKLTKFYQSIHARPIHRMTIESAELLKVFYNTSIGTKIVLANTLMELCHKTGANYSDIKDALCDATDRLISTSYLEGGMGDGGGCHPRDNIAMSYLAKKVGLSYDYFQGIMLSRDLQNQFFLDLIIEYRDNLPIVIYGKAFKPNTRITTGSPALLLYHYAVDQFGSDVLIHDPVIDGEWEEATPALFFIATKHDCNITKVFPKGSVVLDPHRYIPDQEGVKVIRIGEN